MTKELPSIDLLRKLVRYDPDTGKLFWLKRKVDLFSEASSRSAVHSCAIWNTKFYGKEAFTAVSSTGYRHGSMLGGTLFAHRVAWALHSGAWPKNQIDHINGDKTDNRITNLRDVTRVTNSRNSKKKVNNSSGYNGVYRKSKSDLWVSQLTLNGVQKIIGLHKCVTSAAIARKRAEIGLGFTERHGE